MTSKHDGRKVLSNISGIPEGRIQEIWEQVKANQKLLRDCECHDFSIEVPQRGSSRWQCINCKGVVSSGDKRWYELGIEHAENNR